jgi:hypothetical protein
VTITIGGTAFAGTPFARPLTAADVSGGSLTTRTAPNGRWEFLSLPPGNYTIIEQQPANFSDGQEQNGDPVVVPVILNDEFSGASLRPTPVNGPFNFGEIRIGSTIGDLNDPSKREFLGSTVNNGVIGTLVNPNSAGTRTANQPLGPAFTATTGTPNVPALLAIGSGPGVQPQVRVFDFATGGEKFRFLAYEPEFTGGVRVATGDINGDGIEDIVTGTGVGGGPRVRAFSGDDGRVLLDTFLFEPSFRGGLFVAVADVNGDGRGDVIAGTEVGGGPRVVAIDAVTGTGLLNFFAFDANQRGGVRIAAADFNSDGKADIVATTGVGVTTRVRVINSATLSTIADFAPYEAQYTGGVYVASADITGDGVPDILVSADVGGGPRVQVFSGTTFTMLNKFFAYDPAFTGGVRVATANINGDSKADVVLVPGPGQGARVRILRGADLTAVEDFFGLDPDQTGGAYVG